MTSFEKTVKLACKPKAAPPKSKYLDPIIAATWSEDGAVHDVCKALAPRFREPNVIVVFKALIVLHTMIRNGATDNILQYLSSSDVLKLRNVSAGNWEGYQAPQNLQNYAMYLDTRIRAYRELKHDAIRVQSETNRDMRNSAAIDEELEHTGRKKAKNAPPPSSSGNLSRSKTMAGRKLRVMTVEKGLLRETKIVQKMVDSLVECRFYLDNLEDELNNTALRMLVKDLLILFQACNEGVINVLEHYFEMSKIDAKEALDIYKHFCKQTEKVVEYLGVAKKLQNLLNVPIPNLRHAPVSLASSLEEYLNDPNFEQNRIEYKTQKEAAERNAKLGIKASPKPAEKPASSSPNPPEASTSQSSDSAKTPGQKAMIDFFTAIEEEQHTMFNPQTNSPTTAYFQQQAVHNPFQQPMMTGAMLGAQAFGQQPQMQAQPTGFIMPQQTAMPMGVTNPFGLQVQQQPQPTFQPFLAPQQTGFLQPQMTGANPFRQSTLFPQTTGMPFGGQNMAAPQQQPQQQSMNPFPVQTQSPPSNPMQTTSPFQTSQNSSPFQSSPFGQQQQVPAPTGQPSFPFSNSMTGMPSSTSAASTTIAQPFAQPAGSAAASSSAGPPRSATAPLTGPGASGEPPLAQPVKTHQTGSRNPFGQPVTPAPPVPKPPTLMELAMGFGNQNNTNPSAQQQQPMQTGAFGSFGSSFGSQPNGTSSPNANSNSNGTNGSIMANVASSFSFDSSKSGGAQNSSFSSPLTSQPTSSTTSGSTFSDSLFSSLSSQPTGATSSAGAPSISISSAGAGTAPLQRQTTGFSGLKAFKPSSSFGAALLESLPPIPSAPSTPAASPPASNSGSTLSSQPTGFPGLGTQSTGLGSSLSASSSLGVGLRPQATGMLGGANPFRASMLSSTTTGSPSPAGAGGLGGLGSTPSFLNSTSPPAGGAFGASSTTSPFGALGGLGSQPTGASSPFGTGAFGLGSGLNGLGSMNGLNDPAKQQQQQQQQSLF
ncbi:ANTH-domain-containing protein [Lentinus tigrinus ALCF2SS1-7]|uniref:ANTH-domain-containing protein n=1 Tax=Lentinus tigrinus ALCF2SS1-6 TaxID=1328759 RepID=A0A5C2S5F7_9APHY|nr:ANTH-domain-containing protein [Lentinus tigrinus ALCF2SS1-6]RPD73406.1 ANTH-domain-containing protein [Lentinus tigrinus ALCF2SS1-7]